MGRATISEKQFDYIHILKFLACLMITNSHCRNIYPLYFLAIGGGQGNSLFFIVSGFLLANIHLSFGDWIKKRVKRILPVCGLFVGVSILFIESIQLLSQMSLFDGCMLYINKYWFGAAILLYYPIYYLIFSNDNQNIRRLAFFMYLTGYIVLYIFVVDKSCFSVELEGFSWFKVYFYFGMFFFGGMIRKEIGQKRYEELVHRKKWIVAFIITGLIIWTTTYMMVSLLGRGYKIQLLIHVGVAVFAVATFFLAYSYKDYYMPNGWIKNIVVAVANSTLEIYLLQVTIQPYVEKMMFPVSWILFWVGALLGGVFLHEFIEKIEKTYVHF